MKKAIPLIIGVLVLGSSSSLLAKEKKYRPCQAVKSACESAGFVKGGHKNGKGLFVDCMKKVLHGESVEGLNVSSDDVNACKARKEERMAKRKKSA